MTHKIRKANIEDSQIILDFITELASYEELEHHVVGTIEDVQKTLFNDNPRAEVLILEDQNEPAGFALYFHNYSTFLCRYGIYIEDIYVREKYRGKGYGKKLLKAICKEAIKRDCGRVEWWCLDWNKPSIDFYLKLGAEPMSDWTVYRLGREQIENIAEHKIIS
jgi:GNAT superfamily N-acetyltransferase